MITFADEHRFRSEQDSDIRQHLPFLYECADKPGVRVLELGVRSGNSTASFLAAAQKNDGHVWSVDVNYPKVPEWWYEGNLWTLTVGDDLVVEHLQPMNVDVLFIDTSHHYTQTVAELAAYSAHVRPGGVILCHDTELQQPDGAPDVPAFPVKVAIDEFVAAKGWTAEFHAGCYGLGVIRVPA